MNTIIEIPTALFLDRVVLSECSYVFSVLAAEYERVPSVLKTSTPLKDKVDSWSGAFGQLQRYLQRLACTYPVKYSERIRDKKKGRNYRFQMEKIHT